MFSQYYNLQNVIAVRYLSVSYWCW